MIVYCGGSYDVYHSGHVNFLRQCSELAGVGGIVVVSLNTDEFIEQFKGKKPLMSFEERKICLESCIYVDVVIANEGGADSKPAIELVNPDVIAIGTDWASKDYYGQMGFTQEWLDERGILLCYLPYTQGISTTELKRRLNA